MASATPSFEDALIQQPSNVAELLTMYSVEEWDVLLSNIETTENSRQTSDTGVADIVQDIKKVGWMPTSYPQVMFRDLQEGVKMSCSLALSLKAVVIDGNHRIQAAKNVFGGDATKTIRCMCYRNIESASTLKIVSDVCNGTTETFSKRTTSDHLFFYSTLIKGLEDAQNNSISDGSRKRTGAVKAADLSKCWDAVGGQAPSKNTLRAWLSICCGISAPAVQALKRVTANGTDGYKKITKNILADDSFRQLKESPLQQALTLEIFARSRGNQNSGGVKSDLAACVQQAAEAAAWINSVEFIVPRSAWTTQLTKTVNNFAFDRPGYFTNYVKPHRLTLETQVAEMEKALPVNVGNMSEDISQTIRCQQLSAVKKELQSDPTLRPFLDTFEAKLNEAKNSHNNLCLAQYTSPTKKPTDSNDPPHKRPRSSDDESPPLKDADASRSPLSCDTCKAPTTSRYVCDRCSIHHVGDCTNATHLDGEDERSSGRRCIDCAKSKDRPSSRRGSRGGAGSGEKNTLGGASSTPENQPNNSSSSSLKKRRGSPPAPGPRGAVDTADIASSHGASNDLKILRREENTCVHDVMPLSRDFRLDDLDKMVVVKKAMLLVIAPGANEDLLKGDQAWTDRLHRIFFHACDSASVLDSKGTVLVHVPVPWHEHLTRFSEALRQPAMGLVVEDHGLVVEYGSRGGGLKSSAKKTHLSSGPDYFLIAHKRDEVFTCDVKVTPQNFNDRVSVSNGGGRVNPSSEASMTDVPYLGTKRLIHSNVMRFAIQRFTKQGDTVITLAAAKDNAIEIGLEYGRRVEAFVTSPSERELVTRRVAEAWETPWRSGRFPKKSSGGSVSYICNGTLPDGVPVDTTPRGIHNSFNEEASKLSSLRTPEDTAKLNVTVATAAAIACQWCLKSGEDDSLPTLYARDNQSYSKKACSIPLWGRFIIFDSRKDAVAHLSPAEDEPSLEYVRLVLVADNDLLSRMCVPGKEVLRLDSSALYLEVAPTCPAFYAQWEQEEADATHEVGVDLKRGSTREELLKTLSTQQTFIDLRVPKAIKSASVGVAVKVSAGVSVVTQEGWVDTSVQATIMAESLDGSAGAPVRDS